MAEGVERTGGQLLVACLEALGVTRAFGVPGESYLAVLDALHDSPIDFTLTRHEGGAGFMACAWGQLTGAPGIAMVTRGPGATNAAIGVHTARQSSVPMILFVGQVACDMRGREAFQEVDYRAAFGPLAKWATEIDAAHRIPEILARAWALATAGRPGPIVIALPEDMLREKTTAPPLPGPAAHHGPAASDEAVDAARAVLEAADRPLAIVGGGGWRPGAGVDTLRAWLAASSLPTLAAFRFHDLFDFADPSFCGAAGAGMSPEVKTLIREADTILALGIRFGEMTTDGYQLLDVPSPRQKIIHVHEAPDEIGKVYRPALGIQASPARFLESLGPVTARDMTWTASARARFEESLSAPPQPGALEMRAVTEALQEALADDAILTSGAGNFAVWPGRFFRFGPRRRYLGPQSGAMGYGVPAAIAAKLAFPARQVVCFSGDGDFQMTMAELGAAMQSGAAPVFLIVNNSSYGTIRMHQERDYPARVSGTELKNPDFPSLARAYGMLGERVETTAAFAPALSRALAAPTGAVIELVHDVEAISPGRTLTQIREGG